MQGLWELYQCQPLLFHMRQGRLAQQFKSLTADWLMWHIPLINIATVLASAKHFRVFDSDMCQCLVVMVVQGGPVSQTTDVCWFSFLIPLVFLSFGLPKGASCRVPCQTASTLSLSDVLTAMVGSIVGRSFTSTVENSECQQLKFCICEYVITS